MSYYEQCRDIINDNDDLIASVLTELGLETKPKIKCPFHNDSNPSFSHTKLANKNIHFKCWSNEQCPSGDIYNIIMHLRQCTFHEAVQLVCRVAGFEAPSYKQGADTNYSSAEQILASVIAYQDENWDLVKSKSTYKSLVETRHINNETIKLQRIVFLDHTELSTFLSSSDIELFINSISDSLTFEYLLDPASCLIPLYSEQKKIRGCVLYAPDSPKHPSKYITVRSSDSEGVKHACYFNELNGFVDAQRRNEIYICEGVIDCLSMIKAGHNNTIALLGVAYQHDNLLDFIRRNKIQKVYLALDDDEAGIGKINKMLQDIDPDMNIYIFKPNPLKTKVGIKDIDEYINLLGLAPKHEELLRHIRNGFVNIDIYQTQVSMMNSITDYDAVAKAMDEFIYKLITFNKNENDSIKMITDMWDFINNGYAIPHTLPYYIELYRRRIYPTLNNECNTVAGQLLSTVNKVRQCTTYGELETVVELVKGLTEDTLNTIKQDNDMTDVYEFMQQQTKHFYEEKQLKQNSTFSLSYPATRELFRDIPKNEGWTMMCVGAASSGKSVSSYNFIADVLKSNSQDTTVIWLCLDDARSVGDNKLTPILWNVFNPTNKVPTNNYKEVNGEHFQRCSQLIKSLEAEKSLYTLDIDILQKHFKVDITLPHLLDKVILKHFLQNSNLVKPNVILLIDSITSVKGFSDASQGSDASHWEFLKNWSIQHNVCVLCVNEISKQATTDRLIPTSNMAKGSNKNTFKTDHILFINNITLEEQTVLNLEGEGIIVKIPIEETYRGTQFKSTKSSIIVNLHKHKNNANNNLTGIKYMAINNIYGTLEILDLQTKSQLIDYQIRGHKR